MVPVNESAGLSMVALAGLLVTLGAIRAGVLAADLDVGPLEQIDMRTRRWQIEALGS